MNSFRLTVILGCLLLAAGCQTTPKATVPTAPLPTPTPAPTATPVAPGPDTVQAAKEGFSPLAEAPGNNLEWDFHWQNPAGVSGWALRLANESGTLVREIVGTQTVPSTIWDGNDASGVRAAQGKYTAELWTSGPDGVLAEKARSAPVFLDIVPPTGSIDISPVPFQPGPAGEIVEPSSLVTFKLNITPGGSAWSTWRLKVIHPDGTVFRGDFINENYKNQVVSWDGRALNNARLEGGVTYKVEAEVFDIYGNKGTLTGILPVKAGVPAASVVAAAPTPMVVTLDGKKLADLLVFFPPYSSDLDAVSLEQKVRNHQTLDQLTQLLKAATGTKVTVVGNANKVFYDDPVKGDWEQIHTLVPLSEARADAVRQALVTAGITQNTLSTKGIGAEKPLVPFDDAQNRWKNRRVDIELLTQ